MPREQGFSWRKADLFWVAVSLVVLAACLYYPYVSYKQRLPFVLNPNTWNVMSSGTSYQLNPDPELSPQVGDRLLSVGDLTFEEFQRDRTLAIIDAFDENGVGTLRLERKGEIKTIQVRLEPDRGSFFERLPIGALIPLIFWLLGLVAVLFLRPHDERWHVLVAFSFVTALWISSGLASSARTGGGAIVFHAAVWFFLPLAVHLHMILPTSLTERRRLILLPLYAGSLLFAILDAFYLLAGFEYVLSFVVGVLVSLGLLVGRLFLPATPAVKIADRIMLFGVAVGFGPILMFWIVIPLFFPPGGGSSAENYVPFYPWIMSITLIAIPILPMSYVYAIYKHRLGALEFRANRLLGAYSFSAIYITFFVVTLFSVSRIWAPMSNRALAAAFATSMLFLSTALFLRGRFQALVDRHVFGIRHTTEEVVGIVSDRIPKVFDRGVLAQVVVDEILPTLLIRQSALHVFGADGHETLYEQAVPPGSPEPSPADLQRLLARGYRYLPPERSEGPLSWVRLVIPLSVQDETIGLWLIGRRDPDDFFPVSDIHLLTTVANQIAPMLENIRLYEQAQQEIAQRKAAEVAIRRSEERFRTLFEATLEGIALIRDGIVLEVNHALLSIFNSPPEELIGRRLSELVSEAEEDLSGLPREGKGFRRDGSMVDIEIAGKSYVFQGEDVTVVAIRDIARRKEIEEERKALQSQLLVSQKMEAIGRLSAGVAHDFNNCLLAIFGYSDLLIDRYSEDPFLVRNLSGIKEAGQKAAALTKQLLAFARRQPMETRVMDLNVVVSGLEKMLQRLLGEDVTLTTDLRFDLPRVRIDPGQMEQVIVNLAVNARQAMPSGGRLTVRTRSVEVGRELPAPHADVAPGPYVLLEVSDTGVGMDAETQARVFEPFFSTKGDGTGLGLSTAYGIVRQSHGHIFVDSTPGEGTLFSIYLPPTREAETVGVGAVPLSDDRGTETILLVEDEDEVRAVLRQILLGKGYRVLQASSGEEALVMARIHRGPIHLLLSDVTMPQMKGPELAGHLISERPDTRVLFMSGYNEESFAEGLCLQKPFSPQKLAGAVRSVLDDDTALGEEPSAATA
jgi:PAS domain S-box-containing protein